jgi:folate-binding protein YgfZ
MRVYKLNKTVLSFKNNAVAFLNGLTSNAMDKPRSAFLNIHGRIIAVFDQVQFNEEEMLLVVDTALTEKVLVHLDRYARLAGVKINKTEHSVYYDLDGAVSLMNEEYGIPQTKGRLVLVRREMKANVSDEEFVLFRVANHIPWFGIDYKEDEFILNVSEYECVSYTKGCFLGQEPVAKVHNRSKPSNKLVVRFEDECSFDEKLKMTSKVTDSATQRVFGFVFVKNESKGQI